jgi:hypothetical protein
MLAVAPEHDGVLGAGRLAHQAGEVRTGLASPVLVVVHVDPPPVLRGSTSRSSARRTRPARQPLITRISRTNSMATRQESG